MNLRLWMDRRIFQGGGEWGVKRRDKITISYFNIISRHRSVQSRNSIRAYKPKRVSGSSWKLYFTKGLLHMLFYPSYSSVLCSCYSSSSFCCWKFAVLCIVLLCLLFCSLIAHLVISTWQWRPWSLRSWRNVIFQSWFYRFLPACSWLSALSSRVAPWPVQ